MEERHFGPIWMIPGANNGRYPFCHSIYVDGAGLLIDPASDRERLVRLREDPGVEMVWLTHYHEDHFMHLDLFDDLPLWISEQDAYPLSDLEPFMDAYGFDNDSREYWRPVFKEQFHFRPRKPERFLRGGETIRLGDMEVEVIATPGHTPGHLSFLFREQQVLFMADYDLTEFGPWYGDVDSSIEETIHSVERLREVPAKVWITSHETAVFEKEPGKKWDKYLGVIHKREAKLMNLLKKPHTLEEIVGAWIIYKRPRKPEIFYEFGERAMMKKHLQRLIKQGMVDTDGKRYYKA